MKTENSSREESVRSYSQEVLDEMRRYLLMANEEDKLVRIDRVRSSVADV